jgi:sigma-B regulation protein RsbU (phosphoserine phosphatase)
LVLRATILAAVVIAGVGIGSDIMAASPGRFIPWNSVVNIWTLLVLATVNAVPAFAKRYLTIQSPIATFGVLISAAAAIYANLQLLLGLPSKTTIEALAIALFLVSLL